MKILSLFLLLAVTNPDKPEVKKKDDEKKQKLKDIKQAPPVSPNNS